MPKIKIFLWQLCHRALPSRGTLLRRGIHLDPLCPACNTDLEDTDHIFLQCPMAQKVWEMAVAHQWLRSIPFAHSMSTLQAGLQLLAHHPQPQLSRIVLLLWSIWKSRSALIFRNEAPSLMGTLLRAKRNWAEWKLRTSPSFFPSSSPRSHNLSSQAQPSHHIRWKPLNGGSIKINFERSNLQQARRQGSSFVIGKEDSLWRVHVLWRTPQFVLLKLRYARWYQHCFAKWLPEDPSRRRN